MNVGASAPEESGLYFSWGNSPGHTEGSGYSFSQAVYNATAAAAIDSDLSLEQDMARASLGQVWRLPSKEEFQELFDNCTVTWVTQNGVHGRLFTSNINGKSIFMPAAGYYDGPTLGSKGSGGYYWSSSYNSPTTAYVLYFGSGTIDPQSTYGQRWYGFPVRAVAAV